MKISVFGIGYVGAVTAACLSRQGHHVIGVDVHPGKVESLRQGLSPVVEPGVAELLEEAKSRGLLEATTSCDEAVAVSDASLVCVGTPSRSNGDLNLDYVHEVCGKIAQAVRAAGKDRYRLILRSTMLPGSTRSVAEKFFAGTTVEVVFYPEFLREGTAVDDFENPSIEAVGTVSGEEPSPELRALFGTECAFVPWETAELLKYSCNAFHATKVVFANEIGRVGKNLGVDSRQVMELLCRDTRLNLSSYYLRPGNPYGGSCLPKDVSALESLARRESFRLPLIESLKMSNGLHFEHLVRLVESVGLKRVCILGLSFKNQTDDLRGSSMVELAQYLLGRGYDVTAYDPNLDPSHLVGANEKLAAAKLPHLGKILHRDLGDAVGHDSLVVAAQKCVPIDELKKVVSTRHVVLDVNGWADLRTLPSRYEGFCW